jgi:hypothetical protein
VAREANRRGFNRKSGLAVNVSGASHQNAAAVGRDCDGRYIFSLAQTSDATPIPYVEILDTWNGGFQANGWTAFVAALTHLTASTNGQLQILENEPAPGDNNLPIAIQYVDGATGEPTIAIFSGFFGGPIVIKSLVNSGGLGFNPSGPMAFDGKFLWVWAEATNTLYKFSFNPDGTGLALAGTFATGIVTPAQRFFLTLTDKFLLLSDSTSAGPKAKFFDLDALTFGGQFTVGITMSGQAPLICWDGTAVWFANNSDITAIQSGTGTQLFHEASVILGTFAAIGSDGFRLWVAYIDPTSGGNSVWHFVVFDPTVTVFMATAQKDLDIGQDVSLQSPYNVAGDAFFFDGNVMWMIWIQGPAPNFVYTPFVPRVG